MKPLAPVFALSLVLAACAATPPRGGPPEGAGPKGGSSMMDEMCKRHAAEPGRAASAPETMMDKHCKARADAPAGAASHVH